MPRSHHRLPVTMADSTTATTTSTTKRRTSARKVLTAAGKPLRSVGRRLTAKLQKADYGGAAATQTPPRNSRRSSLVETAVSSLRNITSPQDGAATDRMRGSSTRTRSPTNHSTAAAVTDDSILRRFESITRQVCLLAVSYSLGVSKPDYGHVVLKVAEYSAVAWITCVGIWFAAAWQQQQQLPAADEQIPLLASQEQQQEEDEEASLFFADARDLEAAQQLETEELQLAQQQQQQPAAMVHPSLEPYFIVDADADHQQRIYPNTGVAYEMDTDYFSGQMMVLIRTPDVDHPAAASSNPAASSSPAVEFFTGKQRRFEFQFQIRLKKVPTGRVYFCCELQQAVKMGMVQRAFVGAAMAFVKSTNSSFHYSIAGSENENPHMAFAVEEGMNRIVATPSGQPLPVLGQEIYEDDESIKRRKKGMQVEWNMSDTYTMSLWSAYVDFLQWRCINLPGIRPFDLANVIGRQPIHLTLYEIPETSSSQHGRLGMTKIVNIEMCNAAKSGLGPATEQWMAKYQYYQHDDEGDLIMATDKADNGPDLGAVEEEDEALQQDAVAELGEGIYVHSGDGIILRESNVSDSGDDSACFVTNGGGFAVLQKQSSSTIIIEKVEKARFGGSQSSAGSKLIKSGDTVMFKLVSKGRRSEEYLSIHRGWWLKWVAHAPTKNGYFTIYTHETEFSDHGGEEQIMSPETQSSYLTLGGSFWLRHKRWSKYEVGVAAEGSPTYGGRILGLYAPKEGSDVLGGAVNYQSDEGEYQMDPEPSDGADMGKSEWMLPLQLQAYESSSSGGVTGAGVSLKTSSGDLEDSKRAQDEKPKLFFSREHHRVDVPAWLDMMNRTERVRQLSYVVRVIPPEPSDRESSEYESKGEEPQEGTEAFIRLRTGRDLAQLMRVGLNWRNSNASPRQRTPSFDMVPPSVTNPVQSTPTQPARQRSSSTPTASDVARLSRHSFDFTDEADDNSRDEESSDGEWEVESGDEAQFGYSFDDFGVASDTQGGRQKKGRKLIGKLAEKVKTKTTSTSKTVVRRSVKVGKGTMNAGKAIIPIRPKNPPNREPRSTKRRSRRRRERDLHVSVSSRSMKRIERVESRSSFLESPTVLAGELSAPEQSCRTVSNMLSKMSSLSPTSPLATTFSALLTSQINSVSEQDSWFLQGGAIQVGVVPSKTGLGKGPLLLDCLIARCLWESHWREEWCGLYENGIAFYAPLTRTPCLELTFDDIQAARYLDSTAIPGYPLLVIETAWLCHYVAFANKDARSSLHSKLEEAKASLAESYDLRKASSEKELWKARFWQGFQSSLSSGQGKWADIASGTKVKSRVILNNRRMVFDLDAEIGEPTSFVEEILSRSLSFSLDSLKEHPEELVRFLDLTSLLRTFSLQEIDTSSASAFCLFVNLYHCLLQHAMLLSVNGPLRKRSCGHFMRTSCYEIGGDVFSLAELYSCIIRGKMSRPVAPKPPYVEAPRKSQAYRFYALGFTSPRVNFLLNTGDVACPQEVPVLTHSSVEVQLNMQVADYVQRNVHVDVSKKLILIPKICDVYRNDFAPDIVGSGNAGLRYCLSFLDDPTASTIRTMLLEEAPVTIKFQPAAEQYHTTLKLKVLEEQPEFW